MSLKWRARLVAAGIVVLLIAIGTYLYNPDYVLWAGIAGVAGLVLLVGGAVIGRDLRCLRSSRALYYGTSATILTVAVIGIVVFINIIASNHHVRWDLTENQLYSLSDQTRSILSKLDKEVTLHAFVQEGDPTGERLTDLLREYVYRSDKVKLNIVDPDKQPSVAREYEITGYNTVVAEAGDNRHTVHSFDLFSYGYSGRQASFKGEQAITRAIIAVTQGRQGTVYFTKGHGERNLNTEFRQVRTFLKGEGYKVETLNLAEEGEVPEDAAVVVIAGPMRDFVAKEVQAIEDYTSRGGRIFIMLDPIRREGGLSEIKKLVSDWGVSFRDDVVVDPKRNYFVDVLSPIPAYEYHAVTKDLMTENLGIVLPRTRSIHVQSEGERERENAVSILKTSDASWGETNLSLQEVKRDGADAEGPLTVGVAVERTVTNQEAGDTGSKGEKAAGSSTARAAEAEATSAAEENEERRRTARLVAVGSSSFATNDAISFQGNIDFFVNAVNWLAGREDMLSIRPKTQEFRRVVLSGTQANVVFYTTVLFLPLLFLVAAGVATWRRRNL